MKSRITIKGAREHNLKSVDVSIPHDLMTVITGVSGSGKSSLAHDTLHRESLRRYLGGFSAHARQFVGKLGQPDVDEITGLLPSISVDQKTSQRSPRSTVGTMSELLDHLRVLLARVGEVHCYECLEPVVSQHMDGLLDGLICRHPNTDIEILAPIVQGHKGRHLSEFAKLKSQGFDEIKVDGTLIDVADIVGVDPAKVHDIEVVVDRVNTRSRESLSQAVHRALEVSKGVLKIAKTGSPDERYELGRACLACAAPIPEIGPRLFSFNSPYGACESCKGLGVEDQVDPELLVDNPQKTLRQGALAITTPSGYIIYSQVTMDVLNRVCEAHGFHVDIPWCELTSEQRHVVLYGSDRIKIPYGKHTLESRMRWSGITARPREEGNYKGIIPVIEQILKRDRNKNILRFVRSASCSACAGTRYNKKALSVLFDSLSIADLSALTVNQLDDHLRNRNWGDKGSVASLIVEPLLAKTEILRELGLGYLTLDRESTTLSGGEAQRIRLSNQIVSKLQGLLYVLDEPSVGLHPRDTWRLLKMLERVRGNGNTVVVVEHDRDTMCAADWLIDIGPKAGAAGGLVVYDGPMERVLAGEGDDQSTTAAYLTGVLEIPVPTVRRAGNGHLLEIIRPRANNLKMEKAVFKLGAFNVVSGVSGAGKSTLVDNVLARALRQSLMGASCVSGEHAEILGSEHLDKVIEIDQSPIGRTPRSNPATYTKLFDVIREVFAAQPLAAERSWGKGRFSFNVKGGRCETCQGAGVVQVGMHLWEDVAVVCDDCFGSRFGGDTLEVQLRGKSISDVLEMTVSEACVFFEDELRITRFLDVLESVGLGYITLGQPSTTLSGGEAQRVKLAAELARPSTGKTLYILDEPTMGLHFEDVRALLETLGRIVDSGNTVIAVEHDLDFVKTADWIVDLGPDSADDGGLVVASGTPEQIAKVECSHTGRALLRPLGLANEEAIREATAHKGPIARAESIQLKGVGTNNLKNVGVTIPHGRLTVVTGVSGSGKSSLVYDTLFAEGQRAYTESLSSYARRFVKQLARADVESIRGLSPTIAVRQRVPQTNPRSTVATVCGVWDALRLLYSRAGNVHCPHCKATVNRGLCAECGAVGPKEMTAGHFSFNRKIGACDVCDGIGVRLVCDPDRLVTHPERSLLDGALDGSKSGRYYGERDGQHMAILAVVGDALNIDFSRPWSVLDDRARKVAFEGTGEREYNVVWQFKRKRRSGEHEFKSHWKGLSGYIEEEYERKQADKRGEKMRQLMREIPCPSCRGRRLAQWPASVRVFDKTLPELCAMSVDDCRQHLMGILSGELSSTSKIATAVGKRLLKDVVERLSLVEDAGIGYLGLDRALASLSGGEHQRLRIAGQLSSGLVGVTYLFDEPTVGLHSSDTKALIALLNKLKVAGNTVVVVEHDADVIRAADHVIEVGPGPGRSGGHIVASGSLPDIVASDTATGAYLSGRKIVRRETRDISVNKGKHIQIVGASMRNLAMIDVTIPLGALTVVSGPSGSGKSTLVFDVMARSLELRCSVGCDQFQAEGDLLICRVDQSPIGNSPSSCPATYTGVFDDVREVFKNTPHAVARGFKKGRFSFNGKEGRCPACEGMGATKVNLDFIADLWSECTVCNGLRYEPETLECLYKGNSIAEVLSMTVDEAVELFRDEKKLKSKLERLVSVGLGYLQLGQPAPTLSGGEAHRLKLAAELTRTEKEGEPSKRVYVLDEPTTGLHFQDVDRLLAVLDKLVADGHTVVAIEHNLDMIRNADWVIDLGPGGGEDGGELLYEGGAADLVGVSFSKTGLALERLQRV